MNATPVFLFAVAATILRLIDSIKHYAKEMNMLTRFTPRLGLWMSLCLLVAATVSVSMAEAAARADEGKVEAIETSIARPTTTRSTAEP